MPNSSRFVFPVTIAPAETSFSTTVAGYGLVKPFNIFEEHVVGRSEVQILSFTAISRPSISDLLVPVDNLASNP